MSDDYFIDSNNNCISVKTANEPNELSVCVCAPRLLIYILSIFFSLLPKCTITTNNEIIHLTFGPLL